MQLSNSLTPRSVSSSNYLLRQYGGAAAAYSLQRLDTSVENVVRARRSTDDTEADFTAQEVSGGSLREFALNNDADLIRFADQASAADKRMYFDGSNDEIRVAGMTSSADYFGACTIEATIFVENPSATQVVWSLGSDCYRVVSISGQWRLNGATDTSVLVTSGLITIAVDYDAAGQATELRIGGATAWTGTAPAGTTPTTIFYIGSRASGLYFKGLIYDFSLSGSSVKNFAFNGYGNTDTDWEDQVGSNDGTVIGSPALFSGQGFDAYVTTLYDQSGALGQPLSRFAQHATAADTRMYFDGSNDRVDTGYKADATSDFFVEATFIMDELVANQSILADAGSERLVQLLINASGQLQANVLSSAGIQVVATGSTTLVVGQAYTVRLTHDVSESRMTIELDGVQDGTGTYTGTFNAANYNAITVGAFPSGILLFNGLIYDVNFNNESSYQGYGNTNADWEDQIGSNDGTVNGSPSIYEGRNALQATAARQPQIVADGVVVTDSNGNAAMDFDGSDDYLTSATVSAITGNIDHAIFSVFDRTSTQAEFNAAASIGFGATGTAVASVVGQNTTGNAWAGGDDLTNPAGAAIANDNVVLLSKTHASGSTTGYLDGSSFGPSTNTYSLGGDNQFFALGGYTSTAGNLLAAKITEAIFYLSEESSNRAAIEANIASRYGITI